MKEKREQPIKTKKGLVLYNKGGDKWWIEYPDDDIKGRYGGATTIRVMNLIYHIGQGKSIKKADELAFDKVIERRKNQ